MAPPPTIIRSKSPLVHLVRLCSSLGAGRFGGPLSAKEAELLSLNRQPHPDAQKVATDIRAGCDPLGDLLLEIHGLQDRRRLGVFYTPQPVVRRMIDWVLSQDSSRIVDPGCGSGRFAAEVARRDPGAHLVAIDVDPLATLACRATLAVLGAREVRVLQTDFTQHHLPSIAGRTAFVGNPPYVRHHLLTPAQKAWAVEAAARLGLSWSRLAGLHTYFFLATLLNSKPGDVGCFITSAEWLDVRYGATLRHALLNGLGGLGLYLMDRTEATFADAMTTAMITCFEVGQSRTSIRLKHIGTEELQQHALDGGRRVSLKRLEESPRWTPLFSAKRRQPHDLTLVPLGTLARVSRGVATGCNAFFVLRREDADKLGLMEYVVPVLTRAKNVLTANGIVRAKDSPYMLLSPARDLDLFTKKHKALRDYIRHGEKHGVHNAYLCRQRNPWWYLGAKRPPIVATYMARQAPAFALNPDGCAILNVLHGLYPKISFTREDLRRLVHYLTQHREGFRGNGRTYQGGLEKFEPREMEALPVPPAEALRRATS